MRAIDGAIAREQPPRAVRLDRRALLRLSAGAGIAASSVVMKVSLAALAQDAPPPLADATAEPRLIARVRAEEWAALASGPATPAAGEALAGSALLAVLREGGFVIYFRHARTDFSQDDTHLSNLTDCATQRNLSTEGREQARAIGAAMRALAIPIGEVLSSELCRARETAELAFGRATPWPDLTSFGTASSDAEEEERAAALVQLLAIPPEPGTNTVLVGHLFNIQRAVGISLAEGEAAIFVSPRSGAATPSP